MSRIDSAIERLASFVATHNRVVLLVMVIATVGVVAGIPQLEAEQTGAFGDELETQSEVGLAAEYIEEHYEDEGTPTATADVYVRAESGNALSREVLLAALEYQRTVLGDDAVADRLTDRGSFGPQNLVARRLAGEPDPDLGNPTEGPEAGRSAHATVAGGLSRSVCRPVSLWVGPPRRKRSGCSVAIARGDPVPVTRDRIRASRWSDRWLLVS